MARRRMMTEVPKADIVVTNPTHFAVALKYDENAMGAPRVVAKGMDQVAHEHGYSLLLGDTLNDPAREVEYASRVAARQADGLITLSSPTGRHACRSVTVP